MPLSFVADLKIRKFKPTSQKIYLQDIHAFLNYVSELKPAGLKLSDRQLQFLRLEIKARMKDITKEVAVHQLQVRRHKNSKTPLQFNLSCRPHLQLSLISFSFQIRLDLVPLK